jgi:hypothetical protein
MGFDEKSLWDADLQRQPEAAVQPCRCGTMPAPITNVSGDERRRCCSCYCRDLRMSMDLWGN